MGRLLKRVPMDFSLPIGNTWEGYTPKLETFQKLFGEKQPWIMECESLWDICGEKCPGSNKDGCYESASYCVWHNPINKRKWYQEVPEGDGYQVWQNTSDPSPISPVFESLDDLCQWCAEHETVFSNIKATAEEWKAILTGKAYVALPISSSHNIIVT